MHDIEISKMKRTHGVDNILLEKEDEDLKRFQEKEKEIVDAYSAKNTTPSKRELEWLLTQYEIQKVCFIVTFLWSV
jgi:hypothetical protein